MEVDGKAILVESTPTIDTGAYASGDQLGSLMTLEHALDGSSQTGVLMSVTIVDGDSQNAPIDVLFFNSQPSIVSTDNASLDISDNDMATKFLGAVSFGASDYKGLANNSYATLRTVGLFIQSSIKRADNVTGAKIFAILQSRGAPTYTGADKLTLKVGILQD